MVNINYIRLSNNFINCYIKTERLIVLAFEKIDINDIVFGHFMARVQLNKNYLYYIEDEDEVTIYFSIPEEYINNFTYFLNGKYSKFSEEYKKVLLKFFGAESNRTGYEVKVFDVLYPTDIKREALAKHYNVNINIIPQDVLDIPNLDIEVFKSINELTNKENIQI